MASAVAQAENRDDGEMEDKTLNQSFDEAFTLFRGVNDFEGETTSPKFQEKLQKGIKLCEDITQSVTSVDMFSGNESVAELPTNHIKFLLLPFMLGKLWQLKTDKERKDVCVASQIYFQDFLQRLYDYGIITVIPGVMEQDEEKKKALQLSSNDVRAHKITLLKENKALDGKIRALLERQKENEELDEDTSRELFLSVIQRSKNEAVQELESIWKEIELIDFALKREEQKKAGGASGDDSRQAPSGSAPKKNNGGIQTFILTKSEIEKKVFGYGYPGLPVMTVDELYAQRRAEGIWGPPQSTVDNPVSEEEQADREAEAKELQEEADDPERLEQLRNMDEYKDMHRRGWGNRMNRS